MFVCWTTRLAKRAEIISAREDGVRESGESGELMTI
jgi:hypothetical protein